MKSNDGEIYLRIKSLNDDFQSKSQDMQYLYERLLFVYGDKLPGRLYSPIRINSYR